MYIVGYMAKVVYLLLKSRKKIHKMWVEKNLQSSSAPSVSALLSNMTQEDSRSEFPTPKAYLGRISIMGKCWMTDDLWIHADVSQSELIPSIQC